MSTEANISTMLQTKILPTVLGKLVIQPTAFDRIPEIEDYNRVGQTNVARVPRNINDFVVNTLADGAAVTPVTKSTDYIDVTASRKYVAEKLSPGWLTKALPGTWTTKLSNMAESLYQSAVTVCLQAIADTSGIGSEGTDNVAITRATVQATKSALTNAKIPGAGRIMAVSTQSQSDIASISDYADAFSRNGNMLAENVPQVAGFEVIEHLDVLIPDGTAGKENLAFWPQGVGRLHLSEDENQGVDQRIMIQRMDYRGLKIYIWIEADPLTLGGVVLSMSHTSGYGVLRETAVVQLNGR